MEIANFIVVDESRKNLQRGRDGEQFIHTMNGVVIFPIGITIPVIQKGAGCIGLGMVEELRVKADSTTVFFKMFKLNDRAKADAYYSLYQNQLSTGGSDDPYDDTDVIIPGMMSKIPKSSNTTPRPSYRGNDHSSLTDYIDDNYHW